MKEVSVKCLLELFPHPHTSLNVRLEDYLLDVRLDLSAVAGGPLTGQECQRAMARRFKLSVRHGWRLCVVVVTLRRGKSNEVEV